MTPGEFTIPFYKGARWSFTFEFVVVNTDTPLDLTGSGPFTMTVKKANKDQIIASATVTSDYDDTGLVTCTFTAAQTADFPLGEVDVGMRDAANNPYLVGRVPVYRFPPTPA